MTSIARPSAGAAIGSAAVLGAVILGAGGRLLMRAITLWESRAHIFSTSGSITVVIWGTGFGAAAALLRILIDAVCDRWLNDRVSEKARWWAFHFLCMTVTVILLTPLTMHRLVLFPPLVAVFLFAFELSWKRLTISRRGARSAASAA